MSRAGIVAFVAILTSAACHPADPPPTPRTAAAKTIVAPQPLPGTPGSRVAVAPVSGPTAGQPVKSVLNITTPMRYGDFQWDEAGVPAGPVWVRVDLDHQLMSLFRAGHEVGTSVILYGADSKPTPIGTFPIIAKLKDHRSAPYDAPMPYTLRLTPDGVSIHGSNVRWGAATHGCVGVPLAFAEKLFGQVALGTPVVIIPAKRPATPRGAA